MRVWESNLDVMVDSEKKKVRERAEGEEESGRKVFDWPFVYRKVTPNCNFHLLPPAGKMPLPP